MTGLFVWLNTRIGPTGREEAMNARTGRFCHRRTRFPLLSLLVLCACSSHVIAYGVYENVIAPGGDASELFSTASQRERDQFPANS